MSAANEEKDTGRLSPAWHSDMRSLYETQILDGNKVVAVVYGDGVGEEAQRARLIAAAPDGLEAARFALSVLLANPIELSERMAIEKLSAFIAKAEGRES